MKGYKQTVWVVKLDGFKEDLNVLNVMQAVKHALILLKMIALYAMIIWIKFQIL